MEGLPTDPSTPTFVVMQAKKYRANHEQIIVNCPVCGKIMQGWVTDVGWNKHLIQHVSIIEGADECWATDEQLVSVRKAWEAKYEVLEVEVE